MAKIAVLGAGPAGCSAGYHLAQSGHQVTLIDQSRFPRDKVCGDGISLEAIQALATMGLYPQTLRQLAAEYAPIHRFLLGVSNQISHSEPTTLEAYCIPRFVFDQLLYEQALKAGCVPLTQTISKSTGDLQSLATAFDYLIEARGVSVGDVNAIAIRSYWLCKRQSLSTVDLTEAQIHFDHHLGGNGYGWVFPVSTQAEVVKFNVGVGVWLDEYQKNKTNVIQLFKQFIQSNQQTQYLLSQGVQQQTPRVFPLATAQKGQRVFEGNLLKIGDAANLTDPLTGEGIANAVLSGLYVAQAINMSRLPALAGENWQALYESHFEADLRAGLRLRALRKIPFMNTLLIRLMQQYPRVATQVSHAVAGLVPYHEVLSSLRY